METNLGKLGEFQCDLFHEHNEAIICEAMGYDIYVRPTYSTEHPIAATCPECNGVQVCIHGNVTSHTYYETCSTCNGQGTVETSPCIHGYSSLHRYCDHYTNTTRTSHSYCSHDYTSQH